MITGFGNFGTNRFSIWGSRELTGTWNKLYTGELPQGTEMTEEVDLVLLVFGNDLYLFLRTFYVVKAIKKKKK